MSAHSKNIDVSLFYRSAKVPKDFSERLDAGRVQHYLDADLYDFEYRSRRQDVRFYRDFAGKYLGDPTEAAPILELCCGSGRITSAIIKKGFRVVGLDYSAPMLQRAQSRIKRLGKAARDRTMLLRADARDFSLNQEFSYIYMGFNSFEHLYTRSDITRCLERVREHLNPGGWFVFDVQNPDLRWLCLDSTTRWAQTEFRHPKTGARFEYSTNHDYDPVSQILLIRLFYERLDCPDLERKVSVVHLSQRKFFPAELEGLVHAHGFSVVAHLGDFSGKSVHPTCENQVLICQLR